jgi:hypothetical protein
MEIPGSVYRYDLSGDSHNIISSILKLMGELWKSYHPISIQILLGDLESLTDEWQYLGIKN